MSADLLSWTSADGSTTINLSDDSAGYMVLPDGTKGLRSVVYEMVTTRYAGIDGETVNAVRAAANQPTVGLLLSADTEDEFHARAQALVRALRPKAGLGTLTAQRTDGSVRSLPCYCTGGLEGDESATMPGSWWKMMLTFYAPDPWWLGDERLLSVGLGVGAPFFPFFPLALAPSAVQGQFTVDLSDSDSAAFPVWTITGPGSALTLTNNTTNRSLTVNTALSAGQTLIVDTRPGSQSVRLGDGTNAMASVSGYPDLWPLIEDVNTVVAQLTGATTDSRIEATYQPRYAGI